MAVRTGNVVPTALLAALVGYTLSVMGLLGHPALADALPDEGSGWVSSATTTDATVVYPGDDSTANSFVAAEVSSAPTVPEAEFLALINQARGAAGLDDLGWDPTVAQAARTHNQDMLQRAYFYYVSPEGVGAIEQLREMGMRMRSWGENLYLDISIASAHAADMNEPPDGGNRSNVLNPAFDVIGIGVDTRSDGRLLMTVVFIAS